MACLCKACKKVMIPDAQGLCPLCHTKAEVRSKSTAGPHVHHPEVSLSVCSVCGRKADRTLVIREKARLDQDVPMDYLKYIFWPVTLLFKVLGQNTDYRTFRVKIPVCSECRDKSPALSHGLRKSLYDLGGQ